MTKAIQDVVKVLEKSKSILFITGAGISADSGLPTYRGVAGLYNNGKTTFEGVPIETALAGETLYRRPEITWKYLKQIEEKCRSATFNRGHEVIAEMDKLFDRVVVLTQNIDGFHRAAGSRNVIDIHGDLHDLVCMKCGWRNTVKDYSGLEVPPVCPKCKGLVRPDVVFFGEILPPLKTKALFGELAKGFDVYFSIGTTSVFPYIQEPVIEASRRGLATVEINPDDTEVSDLVDIRIRMKAKEALDMILKEYQKGKKS